MWLFCRIIKLKTSRKIVLNFKILYLLKHKSKDFLFYKFMISKCQDLTWLSETMTFVLKLLVPFDCWSSKVLIMLKMDCYRSIFICSRLQRFTESHTEINNLLFKFRNFRVLWWVVDKKTHRNKSFFVKMSRHKVMFVQNDKGKSKQKILYEKFLSED